ncbi:GntR family transcriptional regulator [Streptomyces zagrosensis]|uniref:GntR family phosphonate transport system transcriptional regulator n=1 Tax=Streptomyces zagrosensis TaxID=1042984 RepID=A0A7W9UY24_9ACTN|nr:GntR family transcriptional regulator [Streptomyces zagrosensis]MBB5935475.1 GntR family phosphonate transport system transcriptional regulator [Streptomyces zagrosensis]
MAKKSRYAEIADVLAAEIADQPAGARVSSEHEIAARFAVSRAAARAAVQELEGRLLVRRVRGAGTFVNRRIDYVLSQRKAPSMHQTVREAGGTPRTVVCDVRRVALRGELAARLEQPEGSEAHLLVRQSYIDGLLSGWAQEWIPLDLLPELDAAVHAVESLDSILRQMCGVSPVRAWCRVSYSLPTPEVAVGLESDHTRPVWLIESLSRDGDTGRPVMCSSTWSRPDSTRIIVELDGPWK